MGFDPAKDIFQYLHAILLRLPSNIPRHLAVIGDVDANISRPIFRPGSDFNSIPAELLTDTGCFQQRKRVVNTSADVVNSAGGGFHQFKLLPDEFKKIIHMQKIAHLFSLAAEPDVI